MEKLKVVGNAFLVLVTETALLGASLLVLGSIAAAASGCSENKSGSDGEAVEVNDCREASAWEVVNALGEGYGVKLVGGYYFFTLEFASATQNHLNGFQSFSICANGSIMCNGDGGTHEIRSADGKISWETVYKTGTVSEVAADEIEVLALLGEGYSIQNSEHPDLVGMRCTDCATRHIYYGGLKLTGGHESFFQKASAVYGRIYGGEQLVRDQNGEFVTDNGVNALIKKQEENVAPVLKFLEQGWSFEPSKNKLRLMFHGAPATEEYYGFYMKDDRIFGINGETDEEVLKNRPNPESLALPPKVEEDDSEEDCPCGVPELQGKKITIDDSEVERITKYLQGLDPKTLTVKVLGQACHTDDGGLGTWVYVGERHGGMICLHLPEKGSVSNESPVVQECTTNDDELGKLEDDFDATKYKLGHGYKCVPFRRGF